jgi:hypothetical protein
MALSEWERYYHACKSAGGDPLTFGEWMNHIGYLEWILDSLISGNSTKWRLHDIQKNLKELRRQNDTFTRLHGSSGNR